jgi:hypothetical protein
VLVDASGGAAVAEQCAAAPPLVAITTSVATAVAHYASHSATVVTTGTEADRWLCGPVGPGALVVGGPATTARGAELVTGALAHFTPCLVAGCPAAVQDSFAASLGYACDDISIDEGLRHHDVGLVIILTGSALVPDVALAFGRCVVSERAPLLVDWTLVPTLFERAVGARSAPTLADVLADAVLRSWLTEAASHEVRSRVAVVTVEAAVGTVVEVIDRWHRSDVAGLGRPAGYLDTAGLERRLTTIATEL